MRNRLAALFKEGALDLRPPKSLPRPHPGSAPEAEEGFAGIPGLKLLAEVPLIDDTLRPHERRRAIVAPPPPRDDAPSYALDPLPDHGAALDERIARLERAAVLCQLRYWTAVALSVVLTVGLGLVVLT